MHVTQTILFEWNIKYACAITTLPNKRQMFMYQSDSH